MAGNSKAFYQLDIAQEVGRTAAAVYERICYWEERSRFEHEDGVWMWRTLQQFAEECGVSVSTIRRAIRRLMAKGLILKERLLKKRWNQTCYYRTTRERQNEQPESSTLNTSKDRKIKKDLKITLERTRKKAIAVSKAILKGASGKGTLSHRHCNACEDTGILTDQATNTSYACLCSTGRSRPKWAVPAPETLFLTLRSQIG